MDKSLALFVEALIGAIASLPERKIEKQDLVWAIKDARHAVEYQLKDISRMEPRDAL